MIKLWFKCIEAGISHKDCFYISGKKISHNITVQVSLKELTQSEDIINIDMLGFSKKKITMLTDYYYNKESVDVALSQLKHRREKGTYGSTGVTGYNHFAKKERPQHGPCIQSVIFTHLPRGTINVDIFYRTTEVFKKFAADLIWLKTVLLPPFELDKPGKLTFHFTNLTFHPMYWVVAAPYLDDPVAALKDLHKRDNLVWRGVIRWSARFVRKDKNLVNFKQGYRVSKHLHRLLPEDKMKKLKTYLEKVEVLHA